MSKVNTEQFGPITQIMCCRQRSSDHLISLREKILCIIWYNIEKGTTSPRVACFYQNDCFWVMSQVGQNSASESQPNFNLQIWTKFFAQNVDQSLTTNPTKLQLQNLDQHSASKSWSNCSFKILGKLWSNFSFRISTKHRLKINIKIFDQSPALKSLLKL